MFAMAEGVQLVNKTTAPPEEIGLILRAEHSDPFHILGAHPIQRDGKPAIAIRAFLPNAANAWVVRGEQSRSVSALERVHPDGFFECIFPEETEVFPYRLRVEYAGQHEFEDPYRFPPVLSEFDLYLINEGTHHNAYEKLGAHGVTVEGVQGVVFAVWAPNARRVSVVGNFNNWDGRRHPLRIRGSSGIWELFLPGLGEGEIYKFEIKGRDNIHLALKADPYAFACELRPKTASIVHDLHQYKWRDQEWMEQRGLRQSLESPMAIYEIHLGSWRRVPQEHHRVLNYRELAEQLVDYARDMGFTHLELMPVMEHPLDESWGYQTTGQFAPTSRFGPPDDFRYFVDCCHQRGLGVILDWVPAHFPADAHGLAYFDGTHLYEHEDPRLREHPDWGTRIFNYGRSEVRNFLLTSALFWLDQYHADGLRVDAVASMLYLDYSRKPGEWIPNRYGGNENLDAIDFIKRFNELAYSQHPGVLTIAEESTAWPMVSRPTYLGGLGFSLKWNMGWMHDTLLYFSKDPIHRKYHQNNLTFSLIYAFNENFVLPLSHDEVVHGKRALLSKMPGDTWQQFANLRALYGYFYAHPGKKLLFMGGEIGQWNEWDARQSLDWNLLDYEPHRQVQRLVADLNRLYRSERSLYEVDFEYTGFEWIDFHDADSSVLAFVRRARQPDDYLIVVCNFTPTPRHGYRIGVPEPCFFREVLNTDATTYGGGGLSNAPGRRAVAQPWQNRPCHIDLTLPPLAVVFLKPERSGLG
jgi:1,4-alpha-glucan branching enzyme